MVRSADQRATHQRDIFKKHVNITKKVFNQPTILFRIGYLKPQLSILFLVN